MLAPDNALAKTVQDERILVTGYRPELGVQLISMLAQYFLRQWGNDSDFRTRLADEIKTFLPELDNPRNCVTCAWENGKLIGAVAVDALQVRAEGARIRWFIVDEKYKGKGYGRMLFEQALECCQRRGFDRLTICTFKGRDPALAMYEENGFTLFAERDVSTQKTKIIEQWFEKFI